ncbi:uncharacterized protein LOC107045922 [Diachasma alloeum]|uniref:uncharacterized protein LOC107045922 n=1 Tax=Diachasma alloeum TaxID=454923 RepID=UPI00073846D7|nr:uncharacterized protein LOC107045922 [Diachasma alloeum]
MRKFNILSTSQRMPSKLSSKPVELSNGDVFVHVLDFARFTEDPCGTSWLVFVRGTAGSWGVEIIKAFKTVIPCGEVSGLVQVEVSDPMQEERVDMLREAMIFQVSDAASKQKTRGEKIGEEEIVVEGKEQIFTLLVFDAHNCIEIIHHEEEIGGEEMAAGGEVEEIAGEEIAAGGEAEEIGEEGMGDEGEEEDDFPEN